MGIVTFLCGWEVATRLNLFAPEIPSPTQSANALLLMIADGSAVANVAASLFRVASGFAVGSSLAFFTCCIFWLSPTVRAICELSVDALRPIPPVALIPFAIFVLGLGNAPAIFLVTFAAFFPMQSVTDTGFSNAPRDQMDVARTFGATNLQVLRYVVVPSARAAIMSGLKTSAAISWFVVIVAELVGAQDGLGYLIEESRLSFQLDRAVAAIALIAVSGLFIQALIALATMIVVGRDER